MIGTQIGNYRIEEKLGEGGMGVVYKAIDLDLDRIVAIKVLSADLSKDPGLLERFKAEAKAQAHLNHTNIASLFSLLNVEGHTSIVMEYLEGETFDQILRRRGLIPAQEAVPLFRQALLGVGFAHRMGIVHRDIKPSNIMVNRYGVVKVMDFGIAKVLGGQRLTRTGTQIGTVAYMSPEQIRNRPIDIRSDIYSLGVTLYELLTAHLPFESDSDFQVMSDHVNTPPPPPSRHYPYIPRGIEQCVLKALEKDPDNRFQTVEEFGAALEHPEGIEGWLASRGAVPVTPVPHSGSTPPSGYQTPPPGFQTPAPGYQTPPPGQQTPAPLYNTPIPGATVVQQTPPPVAPGRKPWQDKRLIGAAAVLLLAALSIGGYELFKPKPPVVVAEGGGGGGSTTDTSFASHSKSTSTSSNVSPDKSTSPLLSGNNSTPDTSTSAAKTSAPKTSPDNIDIPADKSTAAPDASLQMVQNARRALRGGHFFKPPRSSAFYYAKQAEQDGNPDGAKLEQAIYNTALTQVQKFRSDKNFSDASDLLADMMVSYPGRPELQQLNASIKDEQVAQMQPPPPQPKPVSPPAQPSWNPPPSNPEPTPARNPTPAPVQTYNPQPQVQAQRFLVQHRHVEFTQGLNAVKTFCSGYMTISPDGVIRYDCNQTQDGRCDHVTFSAADIKQAKITKQGALHISTRTQGNFDFFGAQTQGAMSAISQLIGNRR